MVASANKPTPHFPNDQSPRFCMQHFSITKQFVRFSFRSNVMSKEQWLALDDIKAGAPSTKSDQVLFPRLGGYPPTTLTKNNDNKSPTTAVAPAEREASRLLIKTSLASWWIIYELLNINYVIGSIAAVISIN